MDKLRIENMRKLLSKIAVVEAPHEVFSCCDDFSRNAIDKIIIPRKSLKDSVLSGNIDEDAKACFANGMKEFGIDWVGENYVISRPDNRANPFTIH